MLRLDLNLVWTIVNLIILYLLMKRFLFKPVQNIIAQRQQEADDAFEKAQALSEEADAKKADYEQSMKNVDSLKAEAVSQARQKAAMESEALLKEANEKAKTIVCQANTLANQEKEQILKSAQKEIADLVLDATAKISVSKSTEDTDRALYDEFISQTGKDK